MTKKILISTSTFGQFDESPLRALQEEKIDYILNPYGRTVKESELIELAKDALGIVAGTENLSEAVLKKLSHLKVISRCGVGIDNVDVKTAQELGIKVYTTPEGPTIAVAELVVGLMLNLLRHISFVDREIRNGKWPKKMGSLFYGRQIGIIGLGQIGRSVAAVCKNLGAEVSYFDPQVTPSLIKEFTFLSFPDLLQNSDIISIHVPYLKATHHLISEKEFNLMKKGSYIINCARGGIINEEALLNALTSGKIAGAALDVFEQEPYTGPLSKIDNVLLTPHIGSYAKEARIKMESQAVQNLIKGLKV